MAIPEPAPMSVSFIGAITQLESAERELVSIGQWVADRLEQTRTALRALRAVPAAPPVERSNGKVDRDPPPVRHKAARPPVSREKPARPLGEDGLPSVAAVRDYLADGPVATKQFRTHFGLSSYLAKGVLKQMEASGVVKVTGATTGRRIALAGSTPKEGL